MRDTRFSGCARFVLTPNILVGPLGVAGPATESRVYLRVADAVWISFVLVSSEDPAESERIAA